MTSPSTPRSSLNVKRIAAVVSFLALFLLVISIIGLLYADFLSVFSLSATFLVLAFAAWWVFIGWKWERNVALLVGIVALVLLLQQLLQLAPETWGRLLSVGLAGLIAYLAGRRALRKETPLRARPQVVVSGEETKAVLLMNPRSGGGKAEKFNIKAEAEKLGIEVHTLTKGVDLLELARSAAESGADALGMAGGDGSLGLVASIAMESDIPFVCIPVGTFNHFALDIGLDRQDPVKALAGFRGIERRVDVAVAGERVFLNNLNLGVYPSMIRDPAYRDDRIAAAQKAVSEVLSGNRVPFDLQFRDDQERSYESAFLVLVANNPYAFTGPQTGQRAGLTGGVLQVSVVEARDSDALTRVASGLVLGGAAEVEGSRSWLCDRFEVNARSGRLDAGMDGETVVLEAPLVISLRAKALRVLVPEGTPDEPGIEQGPFNKDTINELLRIAKGQAES